MMQQGDHERLSTSQRLHLVQQGGFQEAAEHHRPLGVNAQAGERYCLLAEGVARSLAPEASGGLRAVPYADAKAALGRCRTELRLLNESAVRSLDEGLEETRTLHQVGLFSQLGRSLKTTNSLESLNSLVEQGVAKVDHWRTSDQK